MSIPKVKSTTVIAIQAVIIAVLISSIVAFVCGIKYAEHQGSKVEAAKAAATATVKK